MAGSPELIFAPRPGVQARQADDGSVLVDLEAGRVFELNRLGREIWQLLDGRRTLFAICEAIVARYRVPPTTVAADVQRVIDDLATAGLISRVTGVSG